MKDDALSWALEIRTTSLSLISGVFTNAPNSQIDPALSTTSITPSTMAEMYSSKSSRLVKFEPGSASVARSAKIICASPIRSRDGRCLSSASRTDGGCAAAASSAPPQRKTNLLSRRTSDFSKSTSPSSWITASRNIGFTFERLGLALGFLGVNEENVPEGQGNPRPNRAANAAQSVHVWRNAGQGAMPKRVKQARNGLRTVQVKDSDRSHAPAARSGIQADRVEG